MKRILSAIIAFSMFFGMTFIENHYIFNNISACAVGILTEKTFENGLKYIININKEAIITGFDERNIEFIEIPAEIESCPVVSIDGCFGDYQNPSSLKEIKFPNTLRYINQGAFYYTSWWDNQPDGVVYADTTAFTYKGIMPQNTVIEFKDGTEKISDNAFSNRKEIVRAIIPDTVEYIGVNAFDECYNLKEITIPNNVRYIGKNAFHNCINLSDVTVFNGIETIECAAFSQCAFEKIKLPDSIKSIRLSAFERCENLTEIVIPDNCESIGTAVFFECKKLKRAFIPESVTEIGERAFGYYTTGYHSATDRVEDFKIYGIKASAAEEYAIENGFEFIEWDGTPLEKFPSDEIEPTLKGDATGDKIVDVRDVAAISRYIVKLTKFTEQEFANADVMKDNIVNINDLTHLKRFLIHDISEL